MPRDARAVRSAHVRVPLKLLRGQRSLPTPGPASEVAAFRPSRLATLRKNLLKSPCYPLALGGGAVYWGLFLGVAVFEGERDCTRGVGSRGRGRPCTSFYHILQASSSRLGRWAGRPLVGLEPASNPGPSLPALLPSSIGLGHTPRGRPLAWACTLAWARLGAHPPRPAWPAPPLRLGPVLHHSSCPSLSIGPASTPLPALCSSEPPTYQWHPPCPWGPPGGLSLL